jgi:hypothetical protein
LIAKLLRQIHSRRRLLPAGVSSSRFLPVRYSPPLGVIVRRSAPVAPVAPPPGAIVRSGVARGNSIRASALAAVRSFRFQRQGQGGQSGPNWLVVGLLLLVTGAVLGNLMSRGPRESQSTAERAPGPLDEKSPQASTSEPGSGDASGTGEVSPFELPDYLEPESTLSDGGVAMGPGPTRRRLMSSNPLGWQRRPPCEPKTIEKKGGCWYKLDEVPPCTAEWQYEDEGKCYVPVPATKRPPPSAQK